MFKIQEYLVQKNLYTQTSLKSHSLFTQNTCDVPNLKNLTTHSWSLLCFCIGSDVLCLTLNSLGIQTCGQNDSTNWRIQDCSSSKMQTEACPFSWYEKPRISEMHVPFRTFPVQVSIDSRDSAMRCVMYPDTHTCLPSTSGPRCFLVIKELAQSVYIRTGRSLKQYILQFIQNSKRVTYFLCVPYARPPIGELRFSLPQPADWTGTWNAAFSQSSCLQPGDPTDSTSSEDCLYLNVFFASSVGKNAPVLVFFHNSGSGVLNGSYLAAVGNMTVVTASFRVAAFGFRYLSSGTQTHTYRNGADIASLHLISSSASASSLIRCALLMVRTELCVPAAPVVMSTAKAQAQTASLARELARLASDTSQLLTCLRSKLAQSINAAQTKLAVSGPLQAWSPVVDGTVVWEKPSVALRSGHFNKVELLLGSSIEAGLISRAKNIEKNFEQLRGRTDSKTAFHAALYNVFSRALENATRLCYDILNENDKIRKKFKPHFKPTLLILHSSIHLSSAFHCHPNQPLAASRTSFSKFLPPWHQFMSHPGGRGYKQLPQCSFWSQYVPALITSTDWKITEGFSPVKNDYKSLKCCALGNTCRPDFDF
uniref:Carboxylesterase type B domain-containing protein n=1 Tax=Cyprinus carpio carpio TaxID=630221 RepID=A0A9J8CJN4_CYPCA